MPLPLEESANPFIEYDVDGTRYKFAKMTVRNRCQMMNDLKQQRRDKLAETMKASGVEPSTVVGTLNDFDATPMTEQDFVAHINTLDGQMAVLRTALQKSHAEKAEEVLDNFTDRPLPLVAALCGLTIGEPKTGGPDPNAQTAPDPAGAEQTPGTCYDS